MITITVKGEEFNLDITRDQYERLRDREGHAQNIAPNIPPCERELFISQITPKEWDKMFGGCHMWDGACKYYADNGKCKYDCRLAKEEDEDEETSETDYFDNPDNDGAADDYFTDQSF